MPITIEINKTERVRWYNQIPKEKFAYELESYLIKNGIDYIGTMDKANVAAENNRLLGIELSYEDQAFRTYYVKQALKNIEQLYKWHEIEKINGVFFPFFMVKEKLMKPEDFISPDLKYGEYFFKDMVKIRNDNHAEYKKFKGFPIPPYFHYDLEFDGMEFQHKTDEKIFYNYSIVINEDFYRSKTSKGMLKDSVS